IDAARNLKGNTRFGKSSLRADDALGDGRFGNEKCAGDFVRGEAAEQAQRERDAGFRGEHRMACGEDQAQEVVANVVVDGGIETGYRRALLLVDVAAELFVLAFEEAVAAEI